MTRSEFNSLTIGARIQANGLPDCIVSAVYFQGAPLRVKVDVVTVLGGERLVVPGLIFDQVCADYNREREIAGFEDWQQRGYLK